MEEDLGKLQDSDSWSIKYLCYGNLFVQVICSLCDALSVSAETHTSDMHHPNTGRADFMPVLTTPLGVSHCKPPHLLPVITTGGTKRTIHTQCG